MANQIHWFPGHMKKALNEVESKIKLVDVVIEILDARCPISSINEQLEKLIVNKKKLVIISKIDLTDQNRLKELTKDIEQKFDISLFCDLKNNNISKLLTQKVSLLAKEKHQKDIKKGMKPQPIRAMILGIPNVGKSSLINRFAKHNVAGVSNRPGFTRGEQWIKVNNDFLLLDTPGILPMNYEDKSKAINLALVGSIKEEILPVTDLCNYLINYLKEKYPSSLKERFGIEEIIDYKSTISEIAKVRHLLANNGELSFDKAEITLLKEFKDGKLGKISLE